MRFIVVVVSIFLACMPAAARENFSKWRCEDPAVMELMGERLKVAKFEGNRSLTSIGVSVKGVSKAKTMHASRDKLVCEVTLRLQGRGNTERITLQYVLQNTDGETIWETWR
jgi:hypothetical protein